MKLGDPFEHSVFLASKSSTRQQPASRWREAPKDLQVLKKNVQKIVQKSGPKTGPGKRGRAKTFLTTFFWVAAVSVSSLSFVFLILLYTM